MNRAAKEAGAGCPREKVDPGIFGSQGRRPPILVRRDKALVFSDFRPATGRSSR